MKKRKVIKLSLLVIISLIIIAVVLIFIPGVQKKLLETQLAPYVTEISVDYIAINPFSARIDELKLKHDELNVHVGHLDARYSLFKLLFGRLKIDHLVLEDTLVEDYSEPEKDASPSPLPLFPGVFPYLNQGLIIDIGHLSLNAGYHSPTSGKVKISAKGDNINELTDNPLLLLTDINELQALPELDSIRLDGKIYLNQHLKKAIDAHTTQLKITLQEVHSTPQTINIDLKMSELDEAPDQWDEFYLTDQYNRYIGELVKPESIDLKIRQTDSQDKLLSFINFKGRYNGNNGILQGKLKINTDKDFLQVIKSMPLPLIESDIKADFSYSLITLDGRIELDDNISIENLKYQSLPERFHIENQLVAEINRKYLTINKLALGLTEDEQAYLKLNTLQPLEINLDNLPAFLETHQNDIAELQITELPLSLFSEFIPDYSIQSGLLSTGLSLSVDGKNLLARTIRPLAINALTVLQNQQQNQKSQTQAPQTDQTLPIAAEDSVKQLQSEQIIVDKLNLNTNIFLTANADKLDLNLPDFTLTQGNSEQLNPLLKKSIRLEVAGLLNQEIKDKPIKLETKGDIYINQILALPVVRSGFDKPVPEALRLNYTIKLNGAHPDWTIEALQTNLTQKESKNLLHLISKQPIKLSQTEDTIELVSEGELLSGYLKHINLAWASPYIEGMELSGLLNEINFVVSAAGKNDYTLNIPHINFLNVSAKKLSSKETAAQESKVLFDNVNLSSQITAHYTPEVISVIYPKLTLDQGKSGLIRNTGSVVISDYTEPEKQVIIAQGKLNGFVHNIMNLGYVQELAKQKLNARSLVDAQYHLEMTESNIKIEKSNINLHHPDTSGKLTVTTIKPVSFALDNSTDNNGSDNDNSDSEKDRRYQFSPNGHLRVTLKNFDSKPYENLLAEQDIAFEHINGQLDIRQKNNRQEIIFKKPLKISNFHFKNEETRPLHPFDLELDLQLSQHKHLISGELKNLSLQFLDHKEQALNTRMKFKLNLNRNIPVRTLEGHLNAMLTHWLEQPTVIPENTLQQGTLSTQFTVNSKGDIKHNWKINDLTDKNNHQIVKSISIDGTGQLRSSSEFELNLPITMDSESGQTFIQLDAIAKLAKDPSLKLDINGKTIFLNDIFKLIDAISPAAETASQAPEDASKEATKESTPERPPISTVVDTEPFWKSAIDIDANLSIDKLYQTDYLAFDQIKGKLLINGNEFKAHDISALFHDGPLKLDSIVHFRPTAKHPYNVDIVLDIKDFDLARFLHELEPTAEPNIEGIFNVDFKMFGEMDNTEQFRNQLLFDTHLISHDGVYHFIPSDSVLLLSSGYAMALAGEVVSVLPTAGFGLGIMSRMVRFIKSFPYDKIDIHLIRNPDKNSTIERFEIFSPELYMHAKGGISFEENTRVFDSPLEMTAKLDLAGEGAAIFYGMDLLTGEKNEYGFWEGPEIKFGGTVNHPTDNFEEIIETAKKGTVAGGVTRPFSGIIGDFKYRWFGGKPDYQDAIADEPVVDKESVTTDKQSVTTDKKATKAVSGQASPAKTAKESNKAVKPEAASNPFFDESF